jgi:pimeloyl-ACP methyl ester carboxylesterase
LADITHRTIQTNGIDMHIAEAGEGPLVVMCHGWPESWYSWRHQLHALADAGFHAVAPDQRGYGQTTAPEPIEAYTQLHLVGDIIGLLDALGEERAVIAGHDWGAPVAWNTAMLRPDRIRGVIGMSVPAGGFGAGYGPAKPTDVFRQMMGDNFFYILYFQTPGVAEHEFQRDVRRTMRSILFGASGNSPRDPAMMRSPLPNTAFFLDQMADPETLPPWLTEEDVDFYTKEFEHAGFRGGINWYRNLDRTYELMAPWRDAVITPPALFVTGDRDVVPATPQVLERMRAVVPNLRDTVVIPGIGHWTQQEAPDRVNEAMISFIRSLD